jgi:hypothetical protein
MSVSFAFSGRDGGRPDLGRVLDAGHGAQRVKQTV